MSEILGQSGLHSEFQVNTGCRVRPCLKKQNRICREFQLLSHQQVDTCKRSFTAFAIPVRGRAVVAHTFNPSTWEGEQADLCEFKASLVYKVPGQLYRETLFQKTKILVIC